MKPYRGGAIGIVAMTSDQVQQDVGAVLLAAGLSRRMGVPKALLRWRDGESLLAYSVRNLLAVGFRPVVVVLGHEAARMRSVLEPLVQSLPSSQSRRLLTVVNPGYRSGRVGSILCGVREALASSPQAPALLVANVDCPVSQETLHTLRFAARSLPGRLLRPVFAGVGGHPPVIPYTLYSELQQIEEQNDGLRALFRRYPWLVTDVAVPDATCLLNLNTPQSYLHACRQFDVEAGLSGSGVRLT